MTENEGLYEFTQEGKNFIYIDFCGVKTNDQLKEFTDKVMLLMDDYPEQSVYTITNVENVRFDSETKEIMARYMEHNKPYVKCGAIIGIDGIKKVMSNVVFTLSGRHNLFFTYTKEQAIQLLLKK